MKSPNLLYLYVPVVTGSLVMLTLAGASVSGSDKCFTCISRFRPHNSSAGGFPQYYHLVFTEAEVERTQVTCSDNTANVVEPGFDAIPVS